jgi:hypothetical protein
MIFFFGTPTPALPHKGEGDEAPFHTNRVANASTL